jgi:protein-S-isoprenylcysteine O-methyltransferase Ste14
MNQTTINYPKILPPTYLLGSILLMLGSHFLFPTMQLMSGLWRLIGILPLVLGIVISYAAEKQFHQARTTVHPFEESSQLITDGLFRFSRNPMYLGMALILLGVALLLGSLTPFGAIVLFLWWIDNQFIRREEQMLATQFGKDWLEYKAQVRRWI